MIIPLAGLFLGALVGAVRARQRGGTGADMAQWGAVHAMIFGLAGLVLLILISRGIG
ncbi:hypothetical protein [Wenxinia saemankumensis]|uniref:PEP-CTERM protein-sorting domain-containing protein n=1 Tax=Wenxinia saemankumensis TaxID=1447782 RepID=A0A1M6HG45_9RHOB|nr:hypothetical protein [Wenxinia saemankumensis]SHJ21178.1 hypothetical protein SAMN05444417_3214 [Wenxinia saemankumensis]